MSSSINKQNAIYAIISDNVYWDVRYGGQEGELKKNSNWTPIPSNWKLISELQDKSSGFTVRTFKNSNVS